MQPGEPISGLPGTVAELPAMFDIYDSPIDSSELASAYGVTPTSVAEFVRGFLASNRLGAG
jgi:NADH dehydrogenase